MNDTLKVLEQIFNLEQEREQKERDKASIAIREFKFKHEPEPPEREKYPPIYAPIRWKVYLLPAVILILIGLIIPPFLFAGALWLVYYSKVLQKKHLQEDEEKIRNSPEYKAQCEAVDARYKERMEIYENETLPEYKAEYEKIKTEKAEKIPLLNKEREEIIHKLENLYQEIEEIPDKYHNSVVIDFLRKKIEADGVGLKDAIDFYERKLQKEEEEKERARRLRAAQEQARREEQARIRREESERRAEERRDFARTATAAAMGSYLGTKRANRTQGRRNQSNSSKRSEDRYFCSMTCPFLNSHRGTGYEPNGWRSDRCRKNPASCGYGHRY